MKMRTLLGIALAGAVVFGVAARADAQFSMYAGNPYTGQGLFMGNNAYGLGGPGLTGYSSGYSGVYGAPVAGYSSGYAPILGVNRLAYPAPVYGVGSRGYYRPVNRYVVRRPRWGRRVFGW